MALDPITGLPADALGSDLFQIPLNTKPVPLEDWQAQGRQGSFLYPDNIPPVMATVAAQHPDTSNAQSLHTDGKHALLVKDVGTATGGTTEPPPRSIRTYDYGGSTLGYGTSELGHDMIVGTVIYGITFCWVYDAGAVYAPGLNAKVEVYIEVNDRTSGRLTLAAIAISAPADGKNVQYTGNVHRTFYPGIMPMNPTDTNPDRYTVRLEETNIGGGNMACCIWADR